jgi:hypothetical protein
MILKMSGYDLRLDYIFIGYEYNSSGYWFLVHKLSVKDIHSNTIMESKNAILFGNVFP